jgi:hypothetical protein
MVVGPNSKGDRDNTSGKAGFVVNGKIDNNRYSFSGEITFLGNRKVKVEFLGEVYDVDLLAGTVTAMNKRN